METFLSLLREFRTELLTLHLLGTALGLGGTTIADVLFLRFLHDFRFSRKEEEVMRVLSRVIVVALLILLISGIALYLPKSAELNVSPRFLMKVVTVSVITVNGVALHLFIIPHLISLSFLPRASGDHPISHTLHRLAFALGGISLTSWYSAFLLAMLKPLFDQLSFAVMLSIYLTVLFGAIIASQIAQVQMSHQALKGSVPLDED